MNKYFKIKKILMLSLIIVLVFFIFRDLKELIAFYKFDINAPDLTADGRMLRNKFYASYYDPAENDKIRMYSFDKIKMYK